MINKQHKGWRWPVVIYIICLHLFVGILIVKTDFIPKFKDKFGLNPYTARPLPPDYQHYKEMLTYHKWMDEFVPEKSVVFLGDSITQGLATAAVAPYSVNYGIGGEITAELIDALPYYKSLHRARAIVLAIGINDIWQGRQQGLPERYSKILDALPKDRPLIWSSVMPVKTNGGWMKMKESDITEANRTIKSLCERRSNCIFVDTWNVLADSNGRIIQQYFLDDGIHPSSSGYRQWITVLNKAMNQIGNN